MVDAQDLGSCVSDIRVRVPSRALASILDNPHEKGPLVHKGPLFMPRISGKKNGVGDVIRTRDLLNHNQMLYQLSYAHHVRENYTTGSYLCLDFFLSWWLRRIMSIMIHTPRQKATM